MPKPKIAALAVGEGCQRISLTLSQEAVSFPASLKGVNIVQGLAFLQVELILPKLSRDMKKT
jgi:hypothetical protein